MGRFKHVFFDLDRTLWDFDRNSMETLQELFSTNSLGELLQADFDDFHSVFRKINAAEWSDFRKGEKSKEVMREDRFIKTFFHFKCGDWKKARKLSEDYISICPYKSHLMEGALEVLTMLQNNCKSHLITNGFSETQRIKINSSGLKPLLDQIVISEETPFRKPQIGIFKLALRVANAQAGSSVMIGDDWRNDILGAKSAKMSQIYLSKERELIQRNKPTFQIDNLLELKEILLD